MKNTAFVMMCLFMNIVCAGENRASLRPSDQFRLGHLEIKKHLAHIEEWTGKLSGSKSAEQRKTMQTIVTFLKEHIKPHAQWEEKKLYPAVDKRACSGPNPFSASMRYEHRIIERWIAELDKAASAPRPDAQKFSRQSEQLLGLIKAHFEEEEEVLLPILDKSMTAAQFKDEILSGAEH